MKKAAIVALLCFVIGFLSLYIGLSVRDYRREMSKTFQVKPNPTPQWTFGEPAQDWNAWAKHPVTPPPPPPPPAKKKAQPEPPPEPTCMMSDQKCAQRTLIKI